MRGTRWGNVIELLSVNSKTKSGANTRAESLAVSKRKNTSIVDLSLEIRRLVEDTRQNV